MGRTRYAVSHTRVSYSYTKSGDNEWWSNFPNPMIRKDEDGYKVIDYWRPGKKVLAVGKTLKEAKELASEFRR